MRCKACDYCDTVGEMSSYHWGLSTPYYSGRFMIDPHTRFEYCLTCWITMNDLYDFQEEVEKNDTEGWPILSMGGGEVELVDTGDAGRDEKTDNES